MKKVESAGWQLVACPLDKYNKYKAFTRAVKHHGAS